MCNAVTTLCIRAHREDHAYREQKEFLSKSFHCLVLFLLFILKLFATLGASQQLTANQRGLFSFGFVFLGFIFGFVYLVS